MIKYLFLLAVLLTSICSLNAQTQKDSALNDLNTWFKPLKWRNIGPFRGGRSVAACGVVNDIYTYYMGTTGGGLWKTTDMGINWANISDGFFKVKYHFYRFNASL